MMERAKARKKKGRKIEEPCSIDASPEKAFITRDYTGTLHKWSKRITVVRLDHVLLPLCLTRTRMMVVHVSLLDTVG